MTHPATNVVTTADLLADLHRLQRLIKAAQLAVTTDQWTPRMAAQFTAECAAVAANGERLAAAPPIINENPRDVARKASLDASAG